MFANVIILAANKNIDREYSYRIPPIFSDKIKIGTKVHVPFGRKKKLSEATENLG